MNHDRRLTRHTFRRATPWAAWHREQTTSPCRPGVERRRRHPERAAGCDVLSELLRKKGFGEEAAGQTRTCRRPPVGGGLPERAPAPATPRPPASWGRPARTTGCRPDPYDIRSPAPRPPPRPGNRGAVRQTPGGGTQTTVQLLVRALGREPPRAAFRSGAVSARRAPRWRQHKRARSVAVGVRWKTTSAVPTTRSGVRLARAAVAAWAGRPRGGMPTRQVPSGQARGRATTPRVDSCWPPVARMRTSAWSLISA